MHFDVNISATYNFLFFCESRQNNGGQKVNSFCSVKACQIAEKTKFFMLQSDAKRNADEKFFLISASTRFKKFLADVWCLVEVSNRKMHM